MLEVDHLHLALLILFGCAVPLSLGLQRNHLTIGDSGGRIDAHTLACLGGVALIWNILAPSLLSAVIVQVLCLIAQWRMPTALGLGPLHARHVASGTELGALLVLCASTAAVLVGSDNVQRTVSIAGHAATMVAVLRVMRVTNVGPFPSPLARRLVAVASGMQLLAQMLFVFVRLCQSAGADRPWELVPLAIVLSLVLMLMAAVSGLTGQVLNNAQRLLNEQAAAAQRDPLTGLLHRGALDQAALAALSQLGQHGGTLTCLAIDVDRFKQINDTAGHLAGDAILTRIALALRENCRSGDIIGRFGGEEFCVLCPDTDSNEASLIAERLRKTIEAISLPETIGGQTTVSIGIAQTRVSYGAHRLARQRWEHLFDSADRALYRAKQTGRNRVVWALSQDGGQPA
jgi:diguanylate cyclase (GGDEF)-like protein